MCLYIAPNPIKFGAPQLFKTYFTCTQLQNFTHTVLQVFAQSSPCQPLLFVYTVLCKNILYTIILYYTTTILVYISLHLSLYRSPTCGLVVSKLLHVWRGTVSVWNTVSSDCERAQSEPEVSAPPWVHQLWSYQQMGDLSSGSTYVPLTYTLLATSFAASRFQVILFQDCWEYTVSRYKSGCPPSLASILTFRIRLGQANYTLPTLLYCTILYYTVLYYTVLCCIVSLSDSIFFLLYSYFTVLFYTVLYCTVLYCTVLYCTVLYCTVLYCTVLYCTVLFCTVQYCTVV